MMSRPSWLVLVLLLVTTAYVVAEEITLTTYYPSPRGVYQELRATNSMVIGSTAAAPANTNVLIHAQGPLGATTPLRIENSDGTALLRVDDNGKVSIGIGDPSEALDVLGRIRTKNNGLASWSSYNGIEFYDDNPTPDQRRWVISNGPENVGALHFRVGASPYSDPWAGGSTKLVIDKAGSVSIGKTTPEAPAPNGQPGNLDANDVFVRSTGQWVSQTTGGTIQVFSCPTFVCAACNGDCNGQLTLNPTCTECFNGDRGFCGGPTACTAIGHLSP